MTSQLAFLGVDYRQANLAVREQLNFTASEQRQLLPKLTALPEVDEALLLVTCNRTELYLAGRGCPIHRILDTFAELRPQGASACEASLHRVQPGDHAALHLFRVAAGIDSQILGDTNVVMQVKQAHRAAAEAGTLGPILDRTVTESLRAAKRARRETTIGHGSASVGAAVLRSIRRKFSSAARILVLGGGVAGQEISRHLAKVQLADLVFSTRNPDQATEMSRAFHGGVVPWEDVPRSLTRFDVVVAATTAQLPFFTLNALKELQAPLVIVDAGVPRNVDPACAALENIHLVDLDSLEQEQGKALEARLREVPRVEAILEQELDRWRRWWSTRYGPPMPALTEVICPKQW
jgi:glutamyl-tRNA reductase